jgi:hypothetical protein
VKRALAATCGWLTLAVLCGAAAGERPAADLVARLRAVASQRAAQAAARESARDPATLDRVALDGGWAARGGSAAVERFFAEPAPGVRRRLLLNAPADSGPAPEVPATAPQAEAAEADRWWQRPLAGRSFGQVVKDDLKLFPRELWKSTKDSANLPTLVVLLAAGGLSGVSRAEWDHDADHELHESHRFEFDRRNNIGGTLGNPFLHFGLAMATYGYSVQAQDDRLYGFSKSAMQALLLTDMVTAGMKVLAHDDSPNDEPHAWPSGHVSSTAALAGVVWEYYGWKAGLPMYLLTGWVATSRLNDREHWLSDVIFGAALGATIGHSVARGRLIEVGGFTVLPYVDPGGGAGVMFSKQF